MDAELKEKIVFYLALAIAVLTAIHSFVSKNVSSKEEPTEDAD